MGARGYGAAQPVYLSEQPPIHEVRLSERDSIMFAGFRDLLGVKELEVILDQSEKTVRKMLADGTLPSVRIGERVYCPKARLIEHVVAQCGEARHE